MSANPETLAAMRAALEAIDEATNVIDRSDLWEARAECLDDTLYNIREKARAALSAPARNCDVGTKEEQHKRFKEFCEERDCHKCPFYGIADCPIEWSNAPFAPEKEKEDNQ